MRAIGIEGESSAVVAFGSWESGPVGPGRDFEKVPLSLSDVLGLVRRGLSRLSLTFCPSFISPLSSTASRKDGGGLSDAILDGGEGS